MMAASIDKNVGQLLFITGGERGEELKSIIS